MKACRLTPLLTPGKPRKLIALNSVPTDSKIKNIFIWPVAAHDGEASMGLIIAVR
jgi:hypothetical protein